MPGSNNARLATDFLRMVASGNVREAYDLHVAADFTHHNPHFESGRQALLEAMELGAVEGAVTSFDVKQVVDAGDRVVVLSHLRRIDATEEYAVVHILRFEGAEIIEMWDVAQVIPMDSPNVLGMF